MTLGTPIKVYAPTRKIAERRDMQHVTLAHWRRRDRMRLPNCTAGPWLFGDQSEPLPILSEGKKKRTLVFFSSVLLHEHSQKGHPPDDSVPSPRERIYLELYHPSIQYFDECNAPAVTHGQPSLLQSRAISFPQIIPRLKRYLRVRTPANGFEEAFRGGNLACGRM